MRTAATTLGLGMGIALAAFAQGPAALAQDDDPPHPASIHAGPCAAPGDVLVALADVSVAFPVDGFPSTGEIPVGSSSAVPIGGSRLTIPLSLSDLVATEHSIVIRASTADPDTTIACGDIGGYLMADIELPVGLAPVDDSGYAGTALLRDNADGSTTVTLLLTRPGVLTAGPVGSPGPAGTPTPIGSPTPTPTSAATPSARPSPQTVEVVALDDRAWWAGFEISYATATHDRAANEVRILGTYANVGTAPQSLLRLQVDSDIAIAWRGQLIEAAFETGAEVPAEGMVEDVLRAQVPPDFTLAEAVLTLGSPAEHQALVPLADGATATSTFPRSYVVSGRAANRGVLIVTAQEAIVVPARCDGTPTAVAFSPANASTLSLVLRVREAAGPDGATATAFAVAPGGASAPGTPGVSSLLGPRERVLNGRYCFTLPAPIQGDHTITIESRTAGVRAQQRSFTITIP